MSNTFRHSSGMAFSPLTVLMIAIMLPGGGYVALGEARRGLTMQMFMIALGIVTWHLTSPSQSVIGRIAGGLFIYALTLPECYRRAKLRHALSYHRHSSRAA